MQIACGNGILACMSRDFGMFMPKHLAEYYLLNSYLSFLSSSKQGKSFFLIRFFCHRSYLITCFFDGCFQFFMIQRFFRDDLCLFLSVRRAYFLDWKCISHRFVHMTFAHAAHHAVHANDCLYHCVSFFLSDLFFTFTECFPPDIPGPPPLFSEPHLLLLSPCIPLQFLFHG